MSLKYDRVIEMLAEDSPIFRDISLETLKESLQVLRILELREQESLVLTGSETNDYLFVVLGRIELHGDVGEPQIVTPSGTRTGPVLLPPLPHTTRIVALQDSFVCHLDNVLFQHLMIFEESIRHSAADKAIPRRYLDIARDSEVFRRIPVELAEQAFRSMLLVQAGAGDEVLTIDKPGDAFYVFVSGRAELWRKHEETGLPELVGELTEGDKFGEDSLLTDVESLTGVRILEESTLLKLEKEAFQKLVAKPLVAEVEAAVAKAMHESGYGFIDVRFDVEYEMEHVPGARLMSYYEVRRRAQELEKDKKYVVYCGHGRLGAAATFILSQMGYDVTNLSGGLGAWVYQKAEGMESEEELIPIASGDTAGSVTSTAAALNAVEGGSATAPEPGEPAAPAKKESCFSPRVRRDSTRRAKGKKTTFICSKDTMSGAYPSLILAINARRMGLDAVVFCTFQGLNVLRKDWAENIRCRPSAMMGAPGIARMTTWMMQRRFKQADYPGFADMRKMAIQDGVRFVACKMTIETMGINMADLIDGVEVATAGEYLELAIDSPVNLFT